MKEEHRKYLADEKRIRELEDAIMEHPGDVGYSALALCEIARQLARLNRKEANA